jgi:hypothetical protein
MDADNTITNTPSLNDYTTNNSAETSNVWKYIIIILILAILGFNLFTYAGQFSKFIGKIIDRIINIFRPILAYFGYGVTETAKKTIDFTATGSKKVIDVASGTLTGGINVLQQGLSKTNKDERKKSLGQDLGRRENKNPPMQYPMPDEAGSNTQLGKAKSKSGFCYIGEDRGFRSCISVGEGDNCMSGDIFPSREVCINPNLR